MEYNNKQLRNIARLKELRTKRGLRVADVVRATGVADSALRKIEIGRYLPRIKSYNKLAQLFGWEPIPVQHVEAKSKAPPPAELRPDFITGHVYSVFKNYEK